MTVVVSPCIHPYCRDEDGNRRLTTQVMCGPCENRLSRELRWIVMDYVTLKKLPSPARPSRRNGQSRKTTPQLSFGHPAQDASDACREIAWLLNGIEAGLRTHVGDRPAPELTRGTQDSVLDAVRWDWHAQRAPLGRSECTLVEHARAYLTGHLEALCAWSEVGAHAGAIHDTHATNRAKYGLTRVVDRLPMPCPSCDVAELVRDVGQVTCENCGRKIREEDYPRLTLIAVDWAIDDYEAEVAAKAALDEHETRTRAALIIAA